MPQICDNIYMSTLDEQSLILIFLKSNAPSVGLSANMYMVISNSIQMLGQAEWLICNFEYTIIHGPNPTFWDRSSI